MGESLKMDCPFCKIVTEKTERIIRETDSTFAVLSNPRLMPGHVLVIPKRHVERLSELSDSERKELFDEAIVVQEKILSEVASGCADCSLSRSGHTPGRQVLDKGLMRRLFG